MDTTKHLGTLEHAREAIEPSAKKLLDAGFKVVERTHALPYSDVDTRYGFRFEKDGREFWLNEKTAPEVDKFLSGSVPRKRE